MSSPSASSPGALAMSPSSTPPSSSPAGTESSSRERAGCQYSGCSRRAKYGPRDEQPIACQAHKRSGQYTINRQGEMMIATRDGDAFRTTAVAATTPPAPSSGTKVSVQATAASDRSRRPSTADSGRSYPSTGSNPGTVSASAAQGVAPANRPGQSSDHVDGTSTAQNRPCLFPGCKSLPEYGLPGAARPVYCLFHKKGTMIRINKEPSDVHSNSDTPQTTSSATASNMDIDEEPGSQAPSAEASTPASKKKTRAPTNKNESGAKKARHGPKAARKDDAANNNGHSPTNEQNNSQAGKGSPESESGPQPTSGGSAATAATKASSPHTSASGNPPANRTAGAAGMAPSAEMIQVNQAREDAKKEAEAAGGGRRPRAPSRRALEASGRLTDEGAQWMTREKKAEEARVKARLKEQRKQLKAAGLRLGVVLEAFVPGAFASDAAGSGGGGGGGDGVDVGVGTGSEEGAGGEAAAPRGGDAGWRKVSPAVLSVPPLQAQATGSWNVAPTVAGETVGKQTTPTAAANSA